MAEPTKEQLKASLEQALAEIDRLTKALEASGGKPEVELPAVFPESLILTVDEVAALSPADADRFRQAGGTAVENPQPQA